MTGSEQAFIGLGWNCVGLVVILAWTGISCFIMFFLLKKLKMLRVETEYEFKGIMTLGSSILRQYSMMTSLQEWICLSTESLRILPTPGWSSNT